jgi:hypothetical protein
VTPAVWPGLAIGSPSRMPGESDGRAWTKSCGRCRRSYALAQWGELPIVERLPAAAVQSHISVPASWTVELRPCVCGAMLAATTRVASR